MKARRAAVNGVDEGDMLRDAFKTFDKDGSGKISKDELKNVVTSYGKMKMTDEDAEDMLRAADFDGDGLINYEEFVKMFTA